MVLRSKYAAKNVRNSLHCGQFPGGPALSGLCRRPMRSERPRWVYACPSRYVCVLAATCMAAHGFAGLPRFLGSSEGAHFCELLRGDGMYRSGTMRFFVSFAQP